VSKNSRAALTIDEEVVNQMCKEIDTITETIHAVHSTKKLKEIKTLLDGVSYGFTTGMDALVPIDKNTMHPQITKKYVKNKIEAAKSAVDDRIQGYQLKRMED
jgi:hypothetical protein